MQEILLPETRAADPRLKRSTIMVVRTMPVSDELLARMPKLRLIVKHGAGIDNIDVAAATRRGIWVANTPATANSTAVAEGAVVLMLALLRRGREMDALVRSGRFDERRRIRLRDLTGARVGLIGFGRIAHAVARICGAGFGAAVAAYDPHVPADIMLALGVEPLDLPELMSRDVVSIHVPLGPGTRKLVGAQELSSMHSSAILVNTSRGPVLDEAALVIALSSGAIAGAGIDVFDPEPLPPDHPLFGLPNVVLSPHVAGVTEDSMRGMPLTIADVIETVVRGGRPSTLINPEVCAYRR
jgi:D-3-phosphoglycerate dehydrogenase / 2-oxoglutarate reductase